jgi:hypothetical protein
MKKPLLSAASNGITPEQREVQIQDMLLERAEEIKKERRDNVVRQRVVRKKLIADLKRMGHLKRCRDCKAMKFYLKNGKAPK